MCLRRLMPNPPYLRGPDGRWGWRDELAPPGAVRQAGAWGTDRFVEVSDRGSDVQFVSEALAELEEFVAFGFEAVEVGAEVVDGASDAAGEAVPAVVVKLEAGVVVVVERAPDFRTLCCFRGSYG